MNTLLTLMLWALPALGAQDAPKPAAPPADAPAAKADAPAASPSPDEKAIRAADAAFLDAYNAGDADAIATLYTEDAVEITEEGERIEGRDAIAARYQDAFQGTPGTIAIAADSVRFVTPDVAEETGTCTITRDDGSAPEITRFTVLFVKQDGKWFIARSRDEEDTRLTPHDHLKELEWMVGEWVNESDEAVVSTTCKWDESGSFLIRDFTAKVEGKPAVTGTQRIGWDAADKQLHSWVFDSTGGHGEGVWSRDGNRWVVKLNGVRADGKRASATQIITFINKDRASWESVDRTVGVEALDDIDAFVLVRKPPEPGK